jgi:hypothetical protein
LSWRLYDSSITDDYTVDDISAAELWSMWRRQHATEDEQPIYWSVHGDGIAEYAPFVRHETGTPQNFLNLARYFAKHICCRLAHAADRAVLLDARLIEFLDGGMYPQCLGLAPLMDMSVAEWWRAMRLFEENPGDYGSFLYQPGIAGVDAGSGSIEKPAAGMLVGWFGIYWRIADDEDIPNQLVGPVMPLIVADWIFGTENRLVLADLAAAVESGDIDPRGKHFGNRIDGAGFDRTAAPAWGATAHQSSPSA